MKNSSTLVLLLACLGFSGLSEISLEAKEKKPAVKASNKKGDAPTPASLVDDMKASFVYIVKNAGDISPKSKQARPFWSALKTIADGVDQMDAGIAKKSPDMLQGLELSGKGITQLAATWGVLRGAHPKSQVGRGVTSLAAAHDMFEQHFGPAVARFKKGGKMTAKEKATIEKSAAQLEGLLDMLAGVAEKAKPKSYQQRMILDLVNLVEQLAAVEGSGGRAYAKYMYQWNRLQNALGAYSNIIQSFYPDYYVSWKTLTPGITAMNSWFTVEDTWSYYEGWDYYSVSIENYESYYEETSVVETIEESEESKYEESVESYDEETAVEEDEDEEEELEEEVEIDEEEDDSLFEEVEDSYGDDDGDGVEDEEDTDDDNDGVCDDQDGDDDGDGVEDEEDADSEEEEEEEMEEDDDDGIAECCEGGCDGCCEE